MLSGAVFMKEDWSRMSDGEGAIKQIRSTNQEILLKHLSWFPHDVISQPKGYSTVLISASCKISTLSGWLHVKLGVGDTARRVGGKAG